MKVSIITTSYNSQETIYDTLLSVKSQTALQNIEHIIVDGKSTDETLSIVNQFDHISKKQSQKDKGLYDAMNKGVQLATGDVIGFLNSDDFFYDQNVVQDIIDAFKKNKCDSLYGDLYYVDQNDTSKITRTWKAEEYSREKFLYGWMPPHPTFYVKRTLFEKLGGFNISLKSSADYELMLRYLYKHKISSHYVSRTFVKMREGGISNRSLKNRINANKEDAKAWQINGLKPKFYTVLLKPLKKLKQFIRN